MRSLTRKVTVAAMTLAVVGAGTVIAQASWTVPGTSTIRAKTATMPRGVQPSAARQGGNALVSWSAQEIAPGVRMRTYVLTAHSLDVPPKRDITRTVAATAADTLSTTFSGIDLAGGKWYWTLVPAFERWTGAESKRSDKLAFPAAATSGDDLAAGSAAPPVTTSDAAAPPSASSADSQAPKTATAPETATTTQETASATATAVPHGETAAATPPQAERPAPEEQTSTAAAGPAPIDPAPAETSSAPAPQ